MERVVGNGANTFFWKHKWIGDECLKNKFSRLFRLSLDKDVKVCEMGVWKDGVWEWVWRWKRPLRDRDLSLLNCLLSALDLFCPK